MSIKLILGVLLLGVLVMVPQMAATSVEAAEGSLSPLIPDSYTIVDDTNRGYLTAENNMVKVVWHYQILPGEYNNRGGGNIYELYDKQSDPQKQRNLVAVVNDGTAGTSPPKAGIGGLGATYLYEAGYNVAISDNAGRARLVSKSYYLDAEGNAVFEAGFIIRSMVSPYPDSYRVDKRWVVHPNGQIQLKIDMEILHSVDMSQPAYNFSFSQDYGWTRASARRHTWEIWNCGGIGSDGANHPGNTELVFDRIDQEVDRDHSLMHNQSFSLAGQSSGVSATVKMDNQGRGFESGGLFATGAALWGTTASPTSEYSNFSDLAYGHTVRFYGWWGGDPPQSDRYKRVEAGTAWSDTLWIEMSPSSTRSAPLIVGDVNVTPESDRAEFNWLTSTASDTRVDYWAAGSTNVQTFTDSVWDTNHAALISGLTIGTTYLYEAKSRDSSGEVVSSGSFVTSGTPQVQLNLAQSGTRWADYDDYVNRILTVEFSVGNQGLQTARSAFVLRSMANMGVESMPSVSSLGDIPSGESRAMELRYRVPAGVTTFLTRIYLSADDDRGRTYYYPEAPPGF